MRNPTPRLAAVRGLTTTASAALACVALAAALPPGAGAAAAPPRPSRQLTSGQLTRRLLTHYELPSGYHAYGWKPNDPTESDHPACISTFDGLDNPTPPQGVTQAQRAFRQSLAGPWLLETLRSYPGQGAARTFSKVTRSLAGCGRFTLIWLSPPSSGTEMFHRNGRVRLGNSSWWASISVVGSYPTDGAMFFVRVGSSTMLLEETAQHDFPPLMPFSQIRAIAALAVSQLTG